MKYLRKILSLAHYTHNARTKINIQKYIIPKNILLSRAFRFRFPLLRFLLFFSLGVSVDLLRFFKYNEKNQNFRF